MTAKLFVILLAAAAACDRAGDEQADAAVDTASLEVNDTVRFDTVTPDNTPAIARAVAPLKFDPATVKAGDRVGSLTVARVRRPPDDYIVSFSGEVELNGQYRPHFDYPEVKLPCFWVDPDSWARLPRSQDDARVIWFCFDNEEQAIAELGPLGTQARATIVIDNYQTMLNQSDVIDQAKLIRVMRKETIQ